MNGHNNCNESSHPLSGGPLRTFSKERLTSSGGQSTSHKSAQVKKAWKNQANTTEISHKSMYLCFIAFVHPKLRDTVPYNSCFFFRKNQINQTA